MAKRIRVVVVGAGPGGYAAAFLAADRKMDVTLVDARERPGGVCLYEGCIPSKALLHAARMLLELREAGAMGIDAHSVRVDPGRLAGWKRTVVEGLAGGLDLLARQRRIRILAGRARFEGPRALRAGDETIEFDAAIVATGSRPRVLPEFPSDSSLVWDSTAALELREVPKTLLVVGGGYIGLELGTVYAALGSKVTLVEATQHLLPGVDRDLVEPLERRLRGLFEEILLRTRVVEAAANGGGVRVLLAGLDLPRTERVFDRVLVAVGRVPNTSDLGLETTAVRVDAGGFIEVDAQRRTAEPTIYAIGDVTRGPALAHKASAEARVAVEAIAGEPAEYDPAALPAVVFTDPEVAWCGVMEDEARRRGWAVETARFPWAASGRAATLGRRDGVTKLVIQKRTGRVLGVGMTGPDAGELIAQGVLAVELGATAEEIARAVFPHPTLSETIKEAAELFFGHSPHFVRREGGARSARA